MMCLTLFGGLLFAPLSRAQAQSDTNFTTSQTAEVVGSFAAGGNPTPLQGTEATGVQKNQFFNLLASLHNFGIVLMAIGIVVAGLFWMGGRPQFAIATLVGSVVLFGAPAFVGLISNAVPDGYGGVGTAGVDVPSYITDTSSIEYVVAYVIIRIQNTVQGLSVILCALYGTLLGIDALLGGLDSARLNSFIIGVIVVMSSPFLVQVFSSVFNG